MKQRRIKELTINHYEQGSSVQYTPSREEEYAAVLAQAEAHQDLRFHMESGGAEVLIILPWESVIDVYATYETVDVTAPTDAICGGASEKGLVVKPKEPLAPAYMSESDVCYITAPAYEFDVFLDGNPVELADFYDNGTIEVEGATEGELGWQLPVDCDALSVTYTTVYTYGGETYSLTVTQRVTLD